MFRKRSSVEIYHKLECGVSLRMNPRIYGDDKFFSTMLALVEGLSVCKNTLCIYLKMNNPFSKQVHYKVFLI